MAGDRPTSTIGPPPAHRAATILLAAVLAGAVSVACVGAAAAARTSRAPKRRAAVRIAGGTADQRRLARMVARRVGGETIRSVRFRAPDRALRRQGARAAELVVRSARPETLRADWEAELFAGTYVALASRYRVPLGGVAAAGGQAPIGRAPHFDIFSNPRARDVARLDAKLTAAAARARARVVELRTATTPARAPALTLRVDDPAAFLLHRALRVLNVLYKTRLPLLGFYVGVEDASGHLIWATSRLPNEGGVFAIPSLDACSPVKHSEPALMTSEPSCPVR